MCDVPLRPLRYINFFEPFHFFTAGDQLVVPIGVTHISLPLYQIQSREQEKKKKKRTNEQTLRVNSSAEGELCNTVHVQTNACVDSSETSTKLLECRLILTRSSFTGLDPLSCRLVSLLSHVDCLCPLSLANCPLLSPFVSSLLASPYHLRSRRDLKSKTLCLVSRQKWQRNRLLGGPPT